MAFNMCLYVPWKTIILIILWKEVYTLPNTVVDDASEKDFSSCEEGWKPYDQYCFKLFNDVKNWMDASNDCKRMGGHLASIHSKEQNDFIERFFTGGFGLFWIGLRDHDLDGIFVWHDETDVTFTYWNPGEPRGKYTSGDCVELYLQENSIFQLGKWLVYKCDHALPYLCQKKFATSALYTSSNINNETIATSAITISNIDSETTTSLTSRNNLDHTNVYILPNTVTDDISVKDFYSCEEGWKPYDHYCFKFVKDALNWTDASNECKSLDGHLASIHSKEQNDFMKTYIGDDVEAVWIGLHAHDLDGVFVWVDESEVTYTKWNTGEPVGDYKSGDCVELYLRELGIYKFDTWVVRPCEIYKPYMCQKKTATSTITSSNTASETTATSTITSSNTVSETTTPLTSRNNLDHTNVYMLPNTVADDVSVKDLSSCEEGWKPYDQYCFKLVKSTLNWTDSSNECKSMGGHLASIHSKEQNDFLETFYNRDRILFWIGLHDHDLDGIFVWDDGSDLNYTNWSPGEPHGQYTSGDCVVLNLGKSSLIFGFKKWLVYKCEYELYYLCKKKIATSSNSRTVINSETIATSSIATILINRENTTSLSARTNMAGTKGFISVTAFVITLLTVIVFMALIGGIIYHKRHWLEETRVKIFYRKAEGPTSTEPYTKLVLEPKLIII